MHMDNTQTTTDFRAANPGIFPLETRQKNNTAHRDAVRAQVLEILREGATGLGRLSASAPRYADAFADIYNLYVAIQPGAIDPAKAADDFVEFVRNFHPSMTAGLKHAGLFTEDFREFERRRDALARSISDGTGIVP
jgi:hypothetical protein